MRFLAWISIGWIGMAVLAALSSRVFPAHLQPSWLALVLAFLALRREPVPLALHALCLGYLAGRFALAPLGMMEAAAVITALTVFIASEGIAGRGAPRFAVLAGFAAGVLHFLSFLLTYWGQGNAGFASVWTMLLVFDAAITALAALVVYVPLLWLEKRLSPKVHGGLSWS